MNTMKQKQQNRNPNKKLLGKVRTTTINKLCLVKRGIVFIVCRTGMQYCPVSGCIQIFAAFCCIAFIFVVSNKFQKPLVSGQHDTSERARDQKLSIVQIEADAKARDQKL